MKRHVAAILLSIFLTTALVAQSVKSDFFRTSDGIRIHYLESGTGPAIVFIPGWTMPAWIWQKQIDAFSAKYHVVAVDPRSQGESDKPSYGHLPETRSRDYKELVDHLGLKQPTLVGWSMGCGELLKYVDQFGTANVGAIVLVDGFIADKPSPEMFYGLSGWMNTLQQDRAKHANLFVRHMFNKPQPEDYIKRLIDTSMQVPADSAVVLIYNMLAIQDWSTGLAKLDKPLLFTYQPENQPSADFLKAKLGDKVRLEKFEGDGHALFVDDPDKFNQVLADFLKAAPTQ
ncbi:MAG TPA: alpha/beta hydrolase [Terriglobales bacterium]|nr:alpha/beta hydrolase [Terriglobales bacterium]